MDSVDAVTQWTQYTVDAVCSGIVVYSTVSTAHCIHWFDLFTPKNNVPTTIYHYFHCTLHTAYCIHWFDFFAPKTMSSPPYTTIPLHTAYCIHWFDLFAPTSTVYCIPHCVGFDLFALKVMVPTTHIC